jgi:putative SOS response-associated peptidase YedK
MCGRYAATANPDELVEEFEIDENRTAEPARSMLSNSQNPPPAAPDYNMAPTKQAPVVLARTPKEVAEVAGAAEAAPKAAPPDSTADRAADQQAGPPQGALPVRQLRLLTWGLVPAWAKDPKIGQRMINARADRVLESGAFARAAASRRCLVPAQGWYEWQKSPVATDAKGKPRKQPFFVHRADGEPVAMAGLYEFWRDPAISDPDDPQAWVTSFTIITTDADPGMDRIHDRQPLVLERGQWERWLDPRVKDPEEVRELLEFSQPGRFEAYPISPAVNSTRSNGPHLLDALPESELVGVVDPMTGEVIGGAG